jgi:glutathione S-transferase
MALTIYGSAASRTSWVLWLAEELGLKYEHVPVNHRAGETRKPEHLAVNPNGHVPAIRDDDLVLWESLAINLYLAKKHGGPIAPKTPADEARALMWSMWALSELEARWSVLLQHTVVLPEDKRNPILAAEAKSALKAPLDVLENALAKSDYLLGDAFTVADLNVAAHISMLPRMKYDLGPWLKISAWAAKCADRPAAGRAREMTTAALRG